MKHANGLFRSIFTDKWLIETKTTHLTYRNKSNSGQFALYDIRSIKQNAGTVFDEIVIITKDDQLAITGFSATGAKNLIQDIESNIKRCLLDLVAKNTPALTELALELKHFLQSGSYIAQIDMRKWLAEIPEISELLFHPYFSHQLLPSEMRDKLSMLEGVREPKSFMLKKRNEEFVTKEIDKYDKLFQKLEKFPLTLEQKRAVVINEDRNLLIAAAGSGKSSTIMSKAIYLIESGLAKPEEILVLAYNKDAQVEIEQRLNQFLNFSPAFKEPVKAKTFHSLGLEVIADVTKKKPSIAKIAAASKTQLAISYTNLIHDLSLKDQSFANNWISYLTIAKAPAPNLDNFKTHKDYEIYLREIGAEWKIVKGSRRLVLRAIDGTEVKSLEELKICNWLVLNGVKYEYEKPYEHDTSTEEYGNYYPDFYYPEAELYHEHFALNKHGKAPDFMKDYERGVDWKRQLHQDHDTLLIETTSAEFSTNTAIAKLEELLKEHEVKFNPLSSTQHNEIISGAFNPEQDTEIFSTFLNHFKSNSTTIAQLRETASEAEDVSRTHLFIDLFEAIYDEYQSRLDTANEIDFADQINMASDFIETNRFSHHWKYVLVDEFQDISQDRKRLVNAILSQNDDVKLFAVGDDWQSIYRFSGADIDIMTHFSDHFGATSQNALTNTFRSYQGIVDVAAKFIQKNPDQIRKTVHSISDIEADQVYLKSYMTTDQQFNQVEEILTNIDNLAFKKKTQLSVFLLARYNHHRPKNLSLISEKFPNLQIQFKSIHASKGLEADYVVLLNVESGEYGFPSTITDDPLLYLVIPRVEEYSHAEERRLMYVALTRAKRAVYILSNQASPSSFILELAEMDRVSVGESIQRENPCPKCDTGDMSIKAGQYGVFTGCSNYPKCDYTKPLECPKCGLGKIVKRTSKHGSFYPCNQYPTCKYIHKPT